MSRNRPADGRGIVLALGGGGARGLAHAGVLEVLEYEGIPIRGIAGTSIGAEIGAFHAHGICGADLVRRCLAMDRTRTLELFVPDFRGGGIASGRRILSFFHELLPGVDFSDLRIPFLAVATDLDSGDQVVLDSGPVAEAVRASASIPGVLAPVPSGGRLLIDGGSVNPVPADVARERFGGPVVAVSVHPAAAPVPLASLLKRRLRWRLRWKARTLPVSPSPGRVFRRAVDIMQGEVARLRSAACPPDLTVTPALADIGILDFQRASEAVEAGRTATVEVLQSLRRLAGTSGGATTPS